MVTSRRELYRRVEKLAQQPPGGIPDKWEFVELTVRGEYHTGEGEWWTAAAEYVRVDQRSGTRRLIGSGPSVRAALAALEGRLAEPLEERRRTRRGGWDTHWQPGRVAEQT
jgi:hypothetical protein